MPRGPPCTIEKYRKQYLSDRTHISRLYILPYKNFTRFYSEHIMKCYIVFQVQGKSRTISFFFFCKKGRKKKGVYTSRSLSSCYLVIDRFFFRDWRRCSLNVNSGYHFRHFQLTLLAFYVLCLYIHGFSCRSDYIYTSVSISEIVRDNYSIKFILWICSS